jgi:hypothetical protein
MSIKIEYDFEKKDELTGEPTPVKIFIDGFAPIDYPKHVSEKKIYEFLETLHIFQRDFKNLEFKEIVELRDLIRELFKEAEPEKIKKIIKLIKKLDKKQIENISGLIKIGDVTREIFGEEIPKVRKTIIERVVIPERGKVEKIEIKREPTKLYKSTLKRIEIIKKDMESLEPVVIDGEEVIFKKEHLGEYVLVDKNNRPINWSRYLELRFGWNVSHSVLNRKLRDATQDKFWREGKEIETKGSGKKGKEIILLKISDRIKPSNQIRSDSG